MAALVTALLALGGWSYVQINQARSHALTLQADLERARGETAAVRVELANERTSAAAAAAHAQERLRALETRWRNKHNEVTREAVEARLAAQAASDSARDAVERLRQRAAEAAASCPAATASTSAAPAAGGQAAAGSAVVLADVLGRIAQRAGQLAEVADQRGVAGLACERAYEEIQDGR